MDHLYYTVHRQGINMWWRNLEPCSMETQASSVSFLIGPLHFSMSVQGFLIMRKAVGHLYKRR
jgi:hypothetical protein